MEMGILEEEEFIIKPPPFRSLCAASSGVQKLQSIHITGILAHGTPNI